MLAESAVFIVFDAPMFALLVATYFRLDELVARSPVSIAPRRAAFYVDRNGYPLCADPDGRYMCPEGSGPDRKT